MIKKKWKKTQVYRKPKVYIACALTLAPKTFIEEIAYFRKKVGKYAEVLDYLGLHHPSAGEVFQYDTNCVRSCDLFVAIVTYPSIGLGVEFGVAVENKKPIITLVQEDAVVSRFVFGYGHPYHYSLKYKTMDQAAKFVIKKITDLFPE